MLKLLALVTACLALSMGAQHDETIAARRRASGVTPIFHSYAICATGGFSCLMISQSGGGTTSPTLPAGASMYVACVGSTGGTMSIADTTSGSPDTFVVANTAHTFGSAGVGVGWYVQSLVGGTTTVTCSSTVNTLFIEGAYIVFTGAVSSPTIDQVGELDLIAGTGGTVSLASTSGTTTHTNELAIGFVGNSHEYPQTWTNLTGVGTCVIPTALTGTYLWFMTYCPITASGVTVTPQITTTANPTSANISFVATFH